MDGCEAAGEYGAGRENEARKEEGIGDAEIATRGSAGVAADTVLAAGQRGVQKGTSGSGGKLLRGDASAKVIEGEPGNMREGGCAARKAECANE